MLEALQSIPIKYGNVTTKGYRTPIVGREGGQTAYGNGRDNTKDGDEIAKNTGETRSGVCRGCHGERSQHIKCSPINRQVHENSKWGRRPLMDMHDDNNEASRMEADPSA